MPQLASLLVYQRLYLCSKVSVANERIDTAGFQ